MAKTIVICSDGTGLTYGPTKSNVARLFKVLELEYCWKQVGGYDPGLGTIQDQTTLCEMKGRPNAIDISSRQNSPTWGERLKGTLIGYGLAENVNELYNVLVDYYEEGDRIFMFGFSRGAFTVRVLAGLLHRCGLLLRKHRDRFWEAFRLYEPHNENYAKVSEFKRRYARPDSDRIEVEFLGLWDTVKSYGYMRPQSLPHTRYNPIVKNVRHALSLGERRSFYIPTTWGGLDWPHDRAKKPQHPALTVREVWFAGDHSDVGGGHADADGRSAAKFSLEWMIGEASVPDRGLLINEDKVRGEFEAMLLKGEEVKTHNLLLDSWYKWLWAEFLPRKEFDNSGFEPEQRFKSWPRGRRHPEQYPRGGKILIHRSVKEILKLHRIEALLEDCRSKGVGVEFVDH